MPPLDTTISRLSRYYLECLSLDDDTGVSVFARSKYEYDYAEVPELLTDQDHIPFDAQGEMQGLIQRIDKDTTRKVPCIGYPVRLREHTSKKGYTFFFVEPVLLFPLERDPQQPGSPLRLNDEPPAINTAILKSFAQGANEAIMQESAALADELGLWETNLPGLEDILKKLIELRPQWGWKEKIDPHALSVGQMLRDIGDEGIYNRAVVYGAEQSKYTKGLENDLNKLCRVTDADLKGTALGHWLADGDKDDLDNIPPQVDPDEKPLLEPIPLNLEQRQAIRSSLSRPLSVVTGPPGTGKSQIVSALLMNAAIHGKRVLFTSKNHKAVDVVESRVNSLGPRPLLMRLGNNDYQAQLADYLASLLGGEVTTEDIGAYNEAVDTSKKLAEENNGLQAELLKLIELRNDVDALEQESESCRDELGEETFQKAATLSALPRLHAERNKLKYALQPATRALQNNFVKTLWFLFRKKRIKHFRSLSSTLLSLCKEVEFFLPSTTETDEDILNWTESLKQLSLRLDLFQAAHDYHAKRILLSESSTLEHFYEAIAANTEQVALSSISFWQAWLKIGPKRLTKQNRTDLGNYIAVLRMIIKADQKKSKAGGQVLGQLRSLFPKVASILNCWAITSLSANGKIPFEPGFFDLVIIDEASQCDIASAIPLLYRAKHAVIIGDPQQLQHISSISPARNTNLLARHDLIQAHARWSYSDNSVYGLASTVVGSGDVTMLLDHHRSHADIIGFSNRYFYDQRLRVATRYDKLKPTPGNEPPVRWIQVTGKTTQPANGSGAQNHDEARAVLDELERLIIDQKYEGTVGVVTPFRAQVGLINRLISNHPHSAILRHRTELLCETAHRFQGDERDLIIFSPVLAAGITSGAVHFLKNTGNLFNVAITRARAALVVIGDAATAATSGVDYLCKFAEYAREASHSFNDSETPKHQNLTENYPNVDRPHQVSSWERSFYTKLYQAGIRPIPQYPVEKYTLDFALIDGERRLDIEVDGERYHKAWNGELLYRDQLRNMRMIELGWDVMRFWVYELRDDPQGCIERVKAWLDKN
jgi:very-short-patch-repair endonuclease